MSTEQDNVMELKVAGKNNVHKTATAIVKNMQEHKKVNVSAIGMDAVNQAVKSIAIARQKVASDNIDLKVRIGFRVLHEEEREKTAILFSLVKD